MDDTENEGPQPHNDVLMRHLVELVDAVRTELSGYTELSEYLPPLGQPHLYFTYEGEVQAEWDDAHPNVPVSFRLTAISDNTIEMSAVWRDPSETTQWAEAREACSYAPGSLLWAVPSVTAFFAAAMRRVWKPAAGRRVSGR